MQINQDLRAGRELDDNLALTSRRTLASFVRHLRVLPRAVLLENIVEEPRDDTNQFEVGSGHVSRGKQNGIAVAIKNKDERIAREWGRGREWGRDWSLKPQRMVRICLLGSFSFTEACCNA
jgi:hypothetical protein